MLTTAGSDISASKIMQKVFSLYLFSQTQAKHLSILLTTFILTNTQ